MERVNSEKKEVESQMRMFRNDFEQYTKLNYFNEVEINDLNRQIDDYERRYDLCFNQNQFFTEQNEKLKQKVVALEMNYNIVIRKLLNQVNRNQFQKDKSIQQQQIIQLYQTTNRQLRSLLVNKKLQNDKFSRSLTQL